MLNEEYTRLYVTAAFKLSDSYFVFKKLESNICCKFIFCCCCFNVITGAIVNIPEAYADSRFNQAIDKKSGYVTKSILALPIFNREKEAIGVLQVMNKKNEQPFDKQGIRMCVFYLPPSALSICFCDSTFN